MYFHLVMEVRIMIHVQLMALSTIDTLLVLDQLTKMGDRLTMMKIAQEKWLQHILLTTMHRAMKWYMTCHHSTHTHTHTHTHTTLIRYCREVYQTSM